MTWMTTRRLLPGVALAACALFGAAAPAQTPEQEKLWDAQRAQIQADEKVKTERLARERAARAADPMSWVRTLDPMTPGGWTFRAVGADGSWAAFSTAHQLKRSGHVVTAWLRQEYAEPHRSPAGDVYSSDVEKVQYDCAKDRSHVMLIVYYTQNNLTGSQQTEEADPKQADWEPIVPGTQSENIFRWTCDTDSARTRPR